MGTGPVKPAEPAVQLVKEKTPKKVEVREPEEFRKKPVNQEKRNNLQRRNRGQKAPPDTAMWVVQRLAEDKLDRTIGILSLWPHSSRQAECSEETINEINKLRDQEAAEVLEELQRPKQYIQKYGKNQMNVDIQLQTLTEGRFLKTKALLDCGSTGSCINKEYVQREGLQTKKVALPIPIYNADGTRNKKGSITKYVPIY